MNSADSLRDHQSFGDIYPTLTYDNARAAIDWLERVFGFVSRLVVSGENDSVRHSELSFGAAVVMVSSPKADMNRVGPKSHAGASQGLCVRVSDVDAHYQIAKAAGAEIGRDLRDEDYGSRGYMAKDIEGHVWYFGTYRPGIYWSDQPAKNPAPE